MSQHVLVIDDEEHIRRVMRMTLETAGYEVGEAEDGPRGLEAFGDGSGWDAVLLDQKMPGMDGLETLRRMKARRPEARVIMVTAFASIELAVDAMKLGATDFVRKPTTPEMLRNAVKAALAKPVTAAAPPPAPEMIPEPPRAPITRLTLNGFRLWRELDLEGRRPLGSDKRRFVVQHPDGQEEDVIVEIGADVVGYVERVTGRRLPVESSYWTWHAEHVLNNFLWNEGKVPPAGKLRIEKMGRDDLQVAARWENEQV
jgi:CheY-like chemotaxis protein